MHQDRRLINVGLAVSAGTRDCEQHHADRVD